MAILWCGGEDIDFVGTVNWDQNFKRTGYGRIGIFAGGAATIKAANTFTAKSSLWFTCRIGLGTTVGSHLPHVGVGNSAVAGLSGVFIGRGIDDTRIALLKVSGATTTELGADSVGTAGNTRKVDVQITNADSGASANAKVYIDGRLAIDYTGDLACDGHSDFDILILSGSYYYASEFIVADTDTRTLSLVTLAPSGAGDTNTWTGAYTDVDEAVLNDGDILTTDTADQDALLAATDLPVGNFTVKAVKVIARATKGATGIGTLKTGIKTGGTIDVDAGQAVDVAWASYQRIMATNPVTSNNWLQSEMDGLQLAFRSAT